MKSYLISYCYETEDNRFYKYKATAVIHSEEELKLLMRMYSSIVIENVWELEF